MQLTGPLPELTLVIVHGVVPKRIIGERGEGGRGGRGGEVLHFLLSLHTTLHPLSLSIHTLTHLHMAASHFWPSPTCLFYLTLPKGKLARHNNGVCVSLEPCQHGGHPCCGCEKEISKGGFFENFIWGPGIALLLCDHNVSGVCPCLDASATAVAYGNAMFISPRLLFKRDCLFMSSCDLNCDLTPFTLYCYVSSIYMCIRI